MRDDEQAVECSSPLRVGFVCVDERSWEFLQFALPVLERALGEAVPGISWRFETTRESERRAGPVPILRHYERAHDFLVRRSLDFSFVVTSGELEKGASPGSSVMVSRSMSSAVISWKTILGDEAPDVDPPPADYPALSERFTGLFLLYIGVLCGLEVTRDAGGAMSRLETAQDLEGRGGYTPQELRRLTRRLAEISAPAGRGPMKEVGLFVFYLRVLVTRPVLILKTALANRPWRLLTRLHKMVFPAVVTVPLALLATEVWQVGANQGTDRLAGIAVSIVLGATAFIVIKQKLMERMPRGVRSERVAVFNYASVLSMLIAVSLVLVLIFAMTLLLTAGIFPRRLVGGLLNIREVTAGDYVRVSFFIACLASVVGWLGAGFTESDDFRAMLFTGSRR